MLSNSGPVECGASRAYHRAAFVEAMLNRSILARSRRGSVSTLYACSCLAVGLALASAAAQAQLAAPENSVLVIGSRLPVTPSGLAQNFTIIDQQQIRAGNPARLEDILARTEGVYVDQAGKGGYSSLYLRGAENSHLLIMIDGVKMNDPTTTRGSAYDLSSIDIAQVERIELLRGPASAIYGGEALAGVLNIIMKKPDGAGVQGSGYAAWGQGDYRKIGGAASFGNPALTGQFSAGISDDGSRSSDSSLKLNTVSGAIGLAPGSAIDARIFGHRDTRKGEAYPDDSGGPRLAVLRNKTVRESTDSVYGVQLGWGELQTVRLTGVATVQDRSEHADNAAVDAGIRFPVPAFLSDTDFRRSALRMTGTREWGPAFSLVAGAEYQKEEGGLSSLGDFDFDGNVDDLSFELTRSTTSVFAEGYARILAGPSLQVGVRHDKITRIDGVTTWHLGSVWPLPNRSTTFKASYSEGFKAPSFFALGFPIGANPDLEPETSRNFELIWAQRLDARGSLLQISAYRIDYQNLVDFVVDPVTFAPLNVNRGLIVVKGIEPKLNWQVSDDLKLRIGLTYLDVSTQDGLAALRNRPTKTASAGAEYQVDKSSSVFAALNYTGNFLDRSNPTGDITQGSYCLLDVGYMFNSGPLQATVAIDNLLDRSFEQFVGFPGQERRLRISMRVSF